MSTVQGYENLQRRFAALRGTGSVTLMGELGGRVIQEAKAIAPRKTGHLSGSIHIASKSATSVNVVAGANYAAYVEYGTGLAGPLHHLIVTGKVMRWATGGASAVRLSGSSRTSRGQALAAFAYARSTKGMKPHPFLIPAARDAVRKVGADVIVKVWNNAA